MRGSRVSAGTENDGDWRLVARPEASRASSRVAKCFGNVPKNASRGRLSDAAASRARTGVTKDASVGESGVYATDLDRWTRPSVQA